MRLLLIALVFGVLFTSVSFSQDKNKKGCCNSEKSKTSMNKICDVPDEVSVSSDKNDNLIASVQGDDKNKKNDKDVKVMDKSIKKDKAKCNTSDEGCCSPDKKKTDKTKNSKS